MSDSRNPTPPLLVDPVIESYKKDLDRTMLRENLKLTPEQRLRKLFRLQRFTQKLREAGRRDRQRAAGRPDNLADIQAE